MLIAIASKTRCLALATSFASFQSIRQQPLPDFTSPTGEMGANISGVFLAVDAVMGIIWNGG